MPKTVEEAKTHRYGTWGGNPRGNAYVEGRCMETVVSNGDYIAHQCHKKTWKDGYCKQHHPETIKAQNDIRNQKWTAKQAIWSKEATDRKNIAIANKFFDYASPTSLKNAIDYDNDVIWIAQISDIKISGRMSYEAMSNVLEQIEKEK